MHCTISTSPTPLGLESGTAVGRLQYRSVRQTTDQEAFSAKVINLDNAVTTVESNPKIHK